ncbi:uncharacterized protein [Rutidosis leptorrhynchoides]|uniref:uncharacterized protein n=1 Tax=Rutidosis leptorrhynchoides TaxID=125765 RepID=UPI003A98F205
MRDKLHPAFTISNIKNHIPITLEQDKAQYFTWSELFKITCRAYDVLDHIIPVTDSSTSDSSTTPTVQTVPSASATALWNRLDAVEIKTVADQLANVGDKVSEPRLVLQLITGLNENYETIGSQLSYITPLRHFTRHDRCYSWRKQENKSKPNLTQLPQMLL